ncbi:MAG: PHB depolymerase family esterase [Pseudobdellovibrionaceae bacterium]
MKWILSTATLVLFSISTPVFAGTWEARSFQNLKYQIFLPQNLNLAPKSSLMITLHGCAQHSEDLAKFANWDAAADKFATVVVAPEVPNGGVLFGCWDYYGTDHTEQNKYHKAVFELLAELSKDPLLKIDSRRVYVSGLSSGAGEALLLGCLRPDLIAGVGLNSSPAVPSDSKDISRPPITGAEMATFCKSLAGANAAAFESQSLSVITADLDHVVNVQHSKVIVDAFQLIYGLQTWQNFDLSSLEGANKVGTGQLLMRNNGLAQLSFITNKGIGHNWAAGSGTTGAQGAYINQNSINYPMYLLEFLETSNQR